MNAIEQLKEQLARTLVGAQLALDAPEDASRGVWWLDVADHGRHVAVEWQAGRSDFGVSMVTDDTGIGDVSDEWLPSVEAAAQRVTELLHSRDLRWKHAAS